MTTTINEASEQTARDRIDASIPVNEQTPVMMKETKKETQKELILEAGNTFNGQLNDYLENVRKQHEQIIDNINIDTFTKSEWERTTKDKVIEVVRDE